MQEHIRSSQNSSLESEGAAPISIKLTYVIDGVPSMSLFAPFTSKHLSLKNRIVMSPMTRQRAAASGIPTSHMATYYGQRASAGLIITEATPVSPTGIGYPNIPGIYTEDQIEGWKTVTKSVHEKEGKIFLQLWHVGRISHPVYQPNGQAPIAPSAIQPSSDLTCYLPDGKDIYPKPRAMDKSDIDRLVAEYAQGAINAIDADFDGVELHCANGYLIDQFLRDGTNRRTDDYGGSIENRLRFMRESLAAIINVVGNKKVGVRISPINSYNDIQDSNPTDLFNQVVDMLNEYDIAFLDVAESDFAQSELTPEFDYIALRARYGGVYIANGGYSKTSGDESIRQDQADLIAFGTPFISNPDLVARFLHDKTLAEVDFSTCYSGGEKGYIDYPNAD